jgi:hypothetical protein
VFKLDEGTFINLGLVESMRVDASVFLVKMSSGETFIVSPAQFRDIKDRKTNQDKVKTVEAY